MPSDLECYVYVVLPGSTEFVTAGRFSLSSDRQGQPVGTFVYGRSVSDQPAVGLRELFGRICFNAAVSNMDDHPRNHALLARSRSWQLSLAYDLTPSPVQAETRRDLAMACGLMDCTPSRWANRRSILAAAGRFLLQPAEAEAIATRIVSTVATSWEASLRESAVSPGDCQRLSRAFLYPGLELDPEVEG
jgi:serine/threonine-protein kinase HipA